MIQYRYIPGQTPLDEEEKRGLIPSVITRKDLDEWEQENILEARNRLMKKSFLAKQEIFTEDFLLDLHKRMFGYVWHWAGKLRKTNKNIGVEFFRIPSETKALIDDANYWLKHQTYGIEEIAIIFHHRLVKIHLFSNGNGRHARFTADAIIAKFGGKKLSWGGKSDLTKPDEIRKTYILALKEADHGNYAPLIAFAHS